MNDLNLFNFISDEDFRESIENDYNELESCIEAKAWKSVHVLAGSIVESILSDYIIALKVVSKSAALKLDLGKIIKLCYENEYISFKSSELSSVIREYRNLIHPGRQIRLKENVDKDSAIIAKSVVKLIIKEVSNKVTAKYGFTAEQIVSKLERDPSAKAIISHLIKDSSTNEIEKLLTKVLPEKYLFYNPEEYEEYERRVSLEVCYREAFNNSDDMLKKKVARWFIRILKEGSSEEVTTYFASFFRSNDFKYYSKENIDLVKIYLFSLLNDSPSSSLLTVLPGITEFMVENEVNKLVDPLIQAIVSGSHIEKESRDFISGEYLNSPINIGKNISARLNDWIEHLESKDRKESLDLIKTYKDLYESIDDIPF